MIQGITVDNMRDEKPLLDADSKLCYNTQDAGETRFPQTTDL